MEWKKKRIYIEDLSALITQLQKLIIDGSPLVENIRCVFTQEGSDIRFMLMPYDFIDLNPKPEINIFYLYQAFKN